MKDSEKTSVSLSLSHELRSALETGAADRHHSLEEEIILRLEQSNLLTKGNKLRSHAELFMMASEVARMTGGNDKSEPGATQRKSHSTTK